MVFPNIIEEQAKETQLELRKLKMTAQINLQGGKPSRGLKNDRFYTRDG